MNNRKKLQKAYLKGYKDGCKKAKEQILKEIENAMFQDVTGDYIIYKKIWGELKKGASH